MAEPLLPCPGEAPPAPEEQAEEALKAGDTTGAREIYQILMGQYPEHYAYQVALARVLLAEGQGNEARDVLDNIRARYSACTGRTCQHLV